MLSSVFVRCCSSLLCRRLLPRRCTVIPRAEIGQKTTTHGGGTRNRTTPISFTVAGILGYLGLAPQEEDDEDEGMDKHTKELIYNIKLGILALQREEYDKSEMLLHIALKMAQDLGNEDGVTYVYDQLANVAFQRGDYMKCERLFKEVLERLLSQGVSPDDNKVVHISLKLAKVYSEWKQDDKADLGYKFCIQIQQEKIKNGSTDDDTMSLWGMSHDWSAQHLMDRQRYKEALQQYKIAYETCTKVMGEESSQPLVILNSIGTVYSLMDDHTNAILHFDRAITTARKIDCQNLPTFLVNMGMARIRQGLKNKAIKACNEGLGLARDVMDKEVVHEAQECLQAARNIKI